MSDDAIQDLLDEASTYATAATSFRTIQRAQAQHRATQSANRAIIAVLQETIDKVVCATEYEIQALKTASAQRDARLRRRKESKRLKPCPLRFRFNPSWTWLWDYDWPYTEEDAKQQVHKDHERVMVHLRERPRLP